VKFDDVSVSVVAVPADAEVIDVVKVAEPVSVIIKDSFEPNGVLAVALIIAPGAPAANAAGDPEILAKVIDVGVEPVDRTKDAAV
jgi:hypothetical protein